MKVYQALASAIVARANCIKAGNQEWIARHQETIADIARNHLPSGSGVDTGTAIWTNDCTPDKIVLFCSFHHMDESGGYDGWTDHKIIVRPAFIGGFDVDVKGINRNEIKDYLGDLFAEALAAEMP